MTVSTMHVNKVRNYCKRAVNSSIQYYQDLAKQEFINNKMYGD